MSAWPEWVVTYRVLEPETHVIRVKARTEEAAFIKAMDKASDLHGEIEIEDCSMVDPKIKDFKL